MTRPSPVLPALSALLSALPLGPLWAAAQHPPIHLESFELDNGLQVVLHRMGHVPAVTAMTTYIVGSAHDADGRSGFAHLFEHLMLEASEHVRQGELVETLVQAGGGASGITLRDRTVFTNRAHSGALERLLYLDAERMAFLRNGLTPEIFEMERAAVANERANAYDSSDAEHYHLLSRELFGLGHPCYWSGFGTPEHIANATLAEALTFHRTHYVPNNAMLVIVGDIELPDARRLIEKYYGAIPRSEPPPPLAVPAPTARGVVHRVVEADVEQPTLYVDWLTPPAYQAGSAALEMIERLLSQRLRARLINGLHLAQRVEVDHTQHQFGGELTVALRGAPGRSLSDLDHALLEEVRRLATEPCDPKELRRLVDRRTRGLLREIQGNGSRAWKLSEYLFHTGMPDYLERDIANYESLTPVDLASCARVFLSPKQRVVLSVVPRGGEALAVVAPAPTQQPTDADTVDWDRRPPIRTPEFDAPRVERIELSNGRPVLLARRPDVSSVVVSVVSRSGSRHDPRDKFGVAYLTGALLESGAGGRSADDITALEEELGATVVVHELRDRIAVDLEVSRSNLEKGIELLSDVALRPTFPERAVEQVRDEDVFFLVDFADRADNLANLCMRRALFGADHPDGNSNYGTASTVAPLRRDDVVQFHRAAFHPERAAIVVVGDVAVEEVLPLLEEAFGGAWPHRATPVPKLSMPDRKRGILLLDRPGTRQAIVRVAALAPGRTSPDFYALEVLTMLLGGTSAARLHRNLNATNGFAYWVRSAIEWRPDESLFYVATSVNNGVAAPAVREIARELDALESEIPDAEIDRAKASVKNSQPDAFLRLSQVAQSVADLYLNDLPLDAHTQCARNIDAVTADDLRRVARKYLGESNLVFVVAGDLGEIEDEIQRLSLGPIEIVDVDDLTHPKRR